MCAHRVIPMSYRQFDCRPNVNAGQKSIVHCNSFDCATIASCNDHDDDDDFDYYCYFYCVDDVKNDDDDDYDAI